MLKKEDVKKDSVLVCLIDYKHQFDGTFTKGKEYKIIYDDSGYFEYYYVKDDADVRRILFDHGHDRLHMFKLKEKTSMLKVEDIKEGMTLVCIGNDYNENAYKVGHEYKVIYNKFRELVIDRISCDHATYNLLISSLTLSNFKLKEETIMLDPEIYAVGTVHKSVNGIYQYKIVARDILIDNELYMTVHDVNSVSDVMFISQSTGKAIKPDTAYDLAITKKKIKGWINIYKYNPDESIDNIGILAATKEEADKNCLNNRIACIEVEFEEGEGW